MRAKKFRVIALAVAATLLAGAMIVPVGAANGVTKKFVRNAIKKAIKKDNRRLEGVFGAFNDGPGFVPTVPPDSPTITSLTLPKGRYAISAKVTIFDPSSIQTECDLVAGGTSLDHGWAQTNVNPNTGSSGVTLNLQAVRSFGPGGGTVTLDCNDHGEADDYEDAKIMAIRQPGITNTESLPTSLTSSGGDPDEA